MLAMMTRLILTASLLLLCAPLKLLAQESQADTTSTGSDMPLSEEARARASEEPLVLDTLEVTAAGFAFQQEVTLRLLRTALERPKSRRQESRDDWVCWIEESTGSSFNYLNCARNGDLWALERPFGLEGPTIPVAGYGTILRSSRPVNRWKLQQAMASLNGSPEFDTEFLALALQGQKPPRDIPDDSELDQFAGAYAAVAALLARGSDESSQIQSIEAQGLTLERYNRIAELTEIYQSLENEVAARLER